MRAETLETHPSPTAPETPDHRLDLTLCSKDSLTERVAGFRAWNRRSGTAYDGRIKREGTGHGIDPALQRGNGMRVQPHRGAPATLCYSCLPRREPKLFLLSHR